MSASSTISQAQGLFRQGDLQLAEVLCRQLLAAQPLDAQALVLLGFIAARKGDLKAALGHFTKAREADPEQPEIHFRAGLLHQQLDENDEALQCFDQALALAMATPGNAAVLQARGISLKKLQRYEEALASYDLALAAAPGNAEILNNRAVVLRQLGRLEEALSTFGKALAANPNTAGIHNNLGVTLHRLTRYEEALVHFNHALALKPGDPDALNNKGMALHELSRLPEAEAAYELSLKADPQSWQTLMNLGVTQCEQKRHAMALQTLDRAEALQPGHPDLRMNRANVLMELGRHDDALQELLAIEGTRPHDAELQMNIANTLREMQRHAEAMRHYNQALDLAPENADVHFNRSLCLLTLGDYERGWEEYEWRTKAKKLGRVERVFPVPLWLGKEPLSGKTILLHAEQGMGDTLLVCRYAPIVAGLGTKVILEVQKPLVNLLKSLDGVSALLAKGEPLPPFDFHCPLMSLPLAMGTTLANVPAQVPYLKAEPARADSLRPAVDFNRLRVGLVWAGNATYSADYKRSLPLELLLEALPDGPQYWCLQKDISERDCALLEKSNKIEFLRIEDFTDTAAQISLLDVVVSVDTSVAQLTAALNCKLWVLLAFAADFRWLAGRTDSVWNPTATIFRQTRPGDWTSVLAAVKSALTSELAQYRA